ncbi:hypothetical protein GCM10029964_032530 [Kibdelosporangium lantanae]
MVTQRIQGGTDRTPGVEHVVHEDHQPVLDAVLRQRGRLKRAVGVPPQVVAVKRDVEHADRDGDSTELSNTCGQPLGQRCTPRRNAHQHDRSSAGSTESRFFDDLMRHSGDSARDVPS